MLRFSSPLNKRFIYLDLIKIISLISFLLATFGLVLADDNPETTTNKITSITGSRVGDNYEIKIAGTTEPSYTVYEMFNPSRIIVDIANASMENSVSFKAEDSIPIQLTTSVIEDIKQPLMRFQFNVPKSLPFNHSTTDNTILLSIDISGQETTGSAELPSHDKIPTITDISVASSLSETEVTIHADQKISDYSYDTLQKDKKNPPRLFIDLKNVTKAPTVGDQKVGTALDMIRVANRDNGLRIVLDSSQDIIFPFAVNEIENGLTITIPENNKADKISEVISEKKEELDKQLPEMEVLGDSTQPSPMVTGTEQALPSGKEVEKSMKDNFSFAGYTKKRITIDFYKIDLHNVFRLLREVSGQNIVVDEAVSGSLTLALTDVPWDFVLDVIVNIKGLQKEERFNTIVILPPNKPFFWPERAEDNLNFEAVEEVAMQEAIIIQQKQNLPQSVIEAKKLISQARDIEKKDDFNGAINLYRDAFEKWPDNEALATKISTLFLVKLRNNAETVYYAQKALALKSDDNIAALNAAIALANMHKFDEAKPYFEQSVSVDNPSRESLLSYAAFAENQKLYPQALKLIEKHNKLHGENLDSMMAEARILDKQGKYDSASEKYTNILLSGFRIPADLEKYIKGRMALNKSSE